MSPRSRKNKTILQSWLDNPYASIVHTWTLAASTAIMFLVIATLVVSNENNMNAAYADSSETQVKIWQANLGENTNPLANNTIINNGDYALNLIENTHANVTCRTTLVDSNGCSDIQSARYVFYRSNLADGAQCDPDDTNCYIGDCSLINDCYGIDDITVTANCIIPVSYNADATDHMSVFANSDWTCAVTPQDHSGTGTMAYDTIEINSLVGLQVDSTINYGTVARGGNTGVNNQLVTVSQSGNHAVAVEVNGTDMPCTSGQLNSDQQHFDTQNLPYELLDHTLSATPRLLDFVLNHDQTNKTLYWGIAIPEDGVSGSCHGTNTFTPIAENTLG